MRSIKNNALSSVVLLTGTWLSVGLTPAFAVATPPMLTDDCHTGIIIEPTDALGNTNSQGYHFSEDCSTGYVLPPKLGKVKLDTFFTNQNTDFCPSLRQAQTSEGVLGDLIAANTAKLVAINDELKLLDLQTEYVAWKTALAYKIAATAELGDAALQRTDFQTAFDDAFALAKQCIGGVLIGDPMVICATQITAYTDARTALNNFNDTVFYPAQAKLRTATTAEYIAKLNYDSKALAFEELTLRLNNIMAYGEDLKDRAHTLYTEYAPLSGAAARLLYTSDWSALVLDFKAANTALLPNVTWKRMPLTKARLMGSLTEFYNTPGQNNLPVMLSATIPGFINYGVGNMPDGTTPLAAEKTVANYFEATGVYNESFGAGINMSLLGVCPVMANPALKADISALINIDTDVEYDLMAHMAYEARFNLYSFFQQIESVRKKRRFFSSSSYRSIYRNRYASESWYFKYTGDAKVFANEDGTDGILEFENSIRAELYAHVLDNIGVRVSGYDSAGQPIVEPSPVGPLAKAMRSSCGTNVYVCAAGWIIGGINSFYGGGSASTNFVERNNSTVSRSVSLVKFFPKNIRTTYQQAR